MFSSATHTTFGFVNRVAPPEAAHRSVLAQAAHRPLLSFTRSGFGALFLLALVGGTQGEEVPGLGDVCLKVFERLHGFLDDVKELPLSGARDIDQLHELAVELFQLLRLQIHRVKVPRGVSQGAYLQAQSLRFADVVDDLFCPGFGLVMSREYLRFFVFVLLVFVVLLCLFLTLPSPSALPLPSRSPSLGGPSSIA